MREFPQQWIFSPENFHSGWMGLEPSKIDVFPRIGLIHLGPAFSILAELGPLSVSEWLSCNVQPDAQQPKLDRNYP